VFGNVDASTLWVTWRLSYKRQELLTLREHLGSNPSFWWVPCCSSFRVFYVAFCLFSSCALCERCSHCLWLVHFALLLRFSRTFIQTDHGSKDIYRYLSDDNGDKTITYSFDFPSCLFKCKRQFQKSMISHYQWVNRRKTHLLSEHNLLQLSPRLVCLLRQWRGWCESICCSTRGRA